MNSVVFMYIFGISFGLLIILVCLHTRYLIKKQNVRITLPTPEIAEIVEIRSRNENDEFI